MEKRGNHTPEQQPPISPDWHRLEVATRRFNIETQLGITEATAHSVPVDSSTARCLAHILGRGLTPESALSEFGRTGEGAYEQLRDEYLELYHHEDAPAWVREHIDWLGSHLIDQRFGSNTHVGELAKTPPALSQILVPDEMIAGEAGRLKITVPANYTASQIEQLRQDLLSHDIENDPALQAYVSLPDVRIVSETLQNDLDRDLAAVYTNYEDGLRDLFESDLKERMMKQQLEEAGFHIPTLEPHLEYIQEQLDAVYDFVFKAGKMYVFYK